MTRDDEIEARFKRQMNDLAADLDDMFNNGLKGEDRTVGFCLLVFPFGDVGRVNYISNAQRPDIIVMLKELLARFEEQPEMEGRG